jgi:hypothetical protein
MFGIMAPEKSTEPITIDGRHLNCDAISRMRPIDVIMSNDVENQRLKLVETYRQTGVCV